LLPEAIDAPSWRELNRKTRQSFGYQWTRRKFSHIIPRFRQDFLNYIYPVKEDSLRAKVCLDAGCGFGRHIYYAACFGARMWGVDFSLAIESAAKNTSGLGDVDLIQADIYRLPFRDNSFDYIYSIGVLHHLPEPEKGFAALVRLLKVKGRISVWLYSKSRPVVNFAIEAVRIVTKRIPHRILYVLCLLISSLEFGCVILPYRILSRPPFLKNLMQSLPLPRIKLYADYPFDILCADWFDRLSAPIRFYYNEQEIRQWFNQADLRLISISPTGGYGWRALGEKL
jgi:SAM-dependent methyltransferase